MPKLYLPLLRAQLIKLEKAFQPGFSTITWTSLEIPSYCDGIQEALNEVDLFVKEVFRKIITTFRTFHSSGFDLFI